LGLSGIKANDPTKKYKEVFISLGGVCQKSTGWTYSPEDNLLYKTDSKEKGKVQAAA